MLKRMISGLLCIMIIFMNVVGVGAESGLGKKELEPSLDLDMEYENIKILRDLPIYRKEKTIMLPLRDVGERLDFEIDWNKELRQVEVTRGSFKTSVKEGLNTYFFPDMKPVKLAYPPMMKEGIIYVPIEFFEKILKQPMFLVRDNLLLVYENKQMEERKIELANIKGYIKEVYKTEEKEYGEEITYTSIHVGVAESDVELSEIIVHLTDETKLYDLDGGKIEADDLKVGGYVDIVTPLFMTMSLPPQTTANSVVLDQKMEIKKISNNGIEHPEFVTIGEDPVSRSIKDILNDSIKDYFARIEKLDIYDDIKLNYMVTCLDDEIISLVFRGDYNILETKREISKTLTLDLKTGLEINLENYLKEDDESQEKFKELIRKAAKQQHNMDYDGEELSFYFMENYLVIYYYEESEEENEVPIELYIPRIDIEDIRK